MHKNASRVYDSDTSGSRVWPIPGSQVAHKERVSCHTHGNLVEDLLGEDLEPLTERLDRVLSRGLEDAVSGPDSPASLTSRDLSILPSDEH
ncbi:uncharacterized protein BDV14DRAFT_178764 [Aspergillus stella-maris]|uniref:uncharacterized protein n=1 Tax=Aspergillus stella-maris TaxID=1810926 RepID=UPI003CCD19A9